jgi:hypothetical protein
MVGNALCEHARREQRNPAARARDRGLVRDKLGGTRDGIGDGLKQHNTGRSVPGCWMFVSSSNGLHCFLKIGQNAAAPDFAPSPIGTSLART